MKDAMNAKEVLVKVNDMIFEGEEYADNHRGLKMRWRIYDICGELSIFDWWNDYRKTLDGSVEGFGKLMTVLKGVAPVPVGEEDITNGANGYYHREEKRIAIRKGMSEAQTIKTLVHEINHSMMHQDEADRDKAEVEAESVAFTVCNYFGIESDDYSFGYVASWADGDMEVFKKSLAGIQKTAHSIIEAVEKGLAA